MFFAHKLLEAKKKKYILWNSCQAQIKIYNNTGNIQKSVVNNSNRNIKKYNMDSTKYATNL